MTTECENMFKFECAGRNTHEHIPLLKDDPTWYSRLSAPVLVFQSRAVPSLLAVGNFLKVFSLTFLGQCNRQKTATNNFPYQ
jgi:hypothetical protein